LNIEDKILIKLRMHILSLIAFLIIFKLKIQSLFWY